MDGVPDISLDRVSLDRICQHLAGIAPLRLAESWDNVGLLVGDRSATVRKVMTCLTLSPDVVDEAIETRADVVIAHHPLPFKPLSKITTDTVTGQILLRLIQAKIAVYSAHTAFDSATGGINQMWANSLGLQSIEPLVVPDSQEPLAKTSSLEGSGRCGRFSKAMTLKDLVNLSATVCPGSSPQMIGSPSAAVSKVAIACGSGGSFLSSAKRRGCEAMVTGEATYHVALEARSLGIGLVLVGHFHSERFAMERLAIQLQEEFADLTVWASRVESDPISIPS